MSVKFVGNASDIQNILGVSALKLIPTYAKPNPQMTKEIASTSKNYHPSQLKVQQKDAKTLGMDPLLEVFPRARINGAIFSYLRDGRTTSYLFKSLFDSNKPLNLVAPNPYEISDSSVTTGKISMTESIEMNLGDEGS